MSDPQLTDTLQTCLSAGTLRHGMAGLNAIEFAFWASVVFLVIVAAIKFLGNRGISRAKIMEPILEFPIDACAVILTLIPAAFVNEMNYGWLLFGLTLLVVLLCCICRYWSLHCLYKVESVFGSVALSTVEIIVVILWLRYVYNQFHVIINDISIING